MEIIELTVGKVFLFFETILNFIIPTGLGLAKLSVYLTSLILTSLMIIWWIKFELVNQDEIDYWQSFLKSRKDFKFIKNQEKNFKRIKAIFINDKIRGLIEIDKFVNSIVDMFGYGEYTLEEKVDKIPDDVAKNKEDLKKSIKIVNLIKEKINKGDDVDLKDEEFNIVFNSYEKFLIDLGIITTENFLVETR
ncbi:MAG: hypothetical protein NZ822_00820 [Patescibacteria group bacterium]|nr:hypothetical protein [Patescibacteria group bacterium]